MSKKCPLPLPETVSKCVKGILVDTHQPRSPNQALERRRQEATLSLELGGATPLVQLIAQYLAKMALFTVNTGCRDQDVCNLRWEWEVQVTEMDTSVFIIPANKVKNREDRSVVLNRIARAVVEEMREVHPEYVFSYKGRSVASMYGRARKVARERAGLPDVRVHDLKHTFGRRLRAGGGLFEDRQDLLGHKSGRITTHDSQAELENLVDAANKVSGENSRKTPARVILKKKSRLARVG